MRNLLLRPRHRRCELPQFAGPASLSTSRVRSGRSPVNRAEAAAPWRVWIRRFPSPQPPCGEPGYPRPPHRPAEVPEPATLLQTCGTRRCRSEPPPWPPPPARRVATLPTWSALSNARAARRPRLVFRMEHARTDGSWRCSPRFHQRKPASSDSPSPHADETSSARISPVACRVRTHKATFFKRQSQSFHRPTHRAAAHRQSAGIGQRRAKLRQRRIRLSLNGLTHQAELGLVQQGRWPLPTLLGRSRTGFQPPPPQFIHERGAHREFVGNLRSRCRFILTRSHDPSPKVQRIGVHAKPPGSVYTDLEYALAKAKIVDEW